jgi:hypothetical protein
LATTENTIQKRKRLNREELKDYVRSHPEEIPNEIGKAFAISNAPVHYRMKELGITHKRNLNTPGTRWK